MSVLCKVILFFVTFTPFVTFAADNIRQNILDAIEDFAKNHKIQAIYSISAKGKILVNGAQGFFDIEENKHLSTSNVMPIASITKQFTAAAILLLQDRGLLSVNDNIAKYLPTSSGVWGKASLPDWAHQVTIHHLLTHSSGIVEYLWNADIREDNTHEGATKNILHFAATQKLEFEPGAQFKYNNTSYVLLGVIIEQVSQQKLANFFKKEFFTPLGMKNTLLLSFSDALNLQKHQTYQYPIRYYAIPSATTPKFTKVNMDIVAVPNADGGLVSNVEDLIKWNEALHHGKILSKASYNQMTHPYFKTPDEQTGYSSYIGYGIFISKLNNGKTYYHHSSSAFGARCDAGYIPQFDLSIAIISNVMLHMPKDKSKKIDLRKPENQIDISYFRDALFESL